MKPHESRIVGPERSWHADGQDEERKKGVETLGRVRCWLKENLKLSLRGSVDRASSTWAGSAEEVENRNGLDRSVRPRSVEEARS